MTITAKAASPHDRLKALRGCLGKTQAEMAVSLQLSTRGYQNYERGDRDIPAAIVERARSAFGLNPRWLWDDEGEMLISTPFLQKAEPIDSALLQTCIEGLEESLAKAGRTMPADKKAELIVKLYDLHVNAGSGHE